MPNIDELEPMPGVSVNDGNDGAIPLMSGFEVLGRILAQKGGVNYTKAELDSGDLPEGTIIDELTAPVQYAGDGLIASVENTGNGEATIVVQAHSMGVAVGFTARAFWSMWKTQTPTGTWRTATWTFTTTRSG